MSLFKEQREQVKRSILDTSISIFKEKGYENATIDEITRTVGVAKGTFYNFFSSKSDILIAWAAEKFQTLEFHEVLDSKRSLEQNLHGFTGILIDAIKQEERLFSCFLQEIFHADRKYSGQFDFLSIYRGMIENSTDARQISGPLLDIKVDVLNHSLFMGIVSWFGAGNTIEGLHEYLLNVVRVCLHGILGQEERKHD